MSVAVGRSSLAPSRIDGPKKRRFFGPPARFDAGGGADDEGRLRRTRARGRPAWGVRAACTVFREGGVLARRSVQAPTAPDQCAVVAADGNRKFRGALARLASGKRDGWPTYRPGAAPAARSRLRKSILL